MINSLKLTGLGPGDNSRLRDWLQLPHVEAWWGNRARAEAEVTLALESPSAICRMVRSGDVPIGYGQALDTALLGDADGKVEGGSWSCALFIATDHYRGQGLGQIAVRMLVAEVFETTLAVACTMRIPVGKENAVRAVEAAGFRWQRIEADDALGRVWLMRAERPRI